MYIPVHTKIYQKQKDTKKVKGERMEKIQQANTSQQLS